jgi:hypothetical protein
MSKLTADLIKNVTTLLQDPENRKIVNEGQDVFEVSYKEYTALKTARIHFDFDFYEFIPPLERLPECLQFIVLRYCIKLLPAFRIPSNKVKELKNKLEKGREHIRNFVVDIKDSEPYIMYADHGSFLAEFKQRLDNKLWLEYHAMSKTIPATLSGDLLESGAITVEELCEEYKNIMSV